MRKIRPKMRNQSQRHEQKGEWFANFDQDHNLGSMLSSAHQDSIPSDEQARLSVTLPRSLYKRLKLAAHDNDTTVSSLIIKLIRSELC
jgi:hypothetical protein